MLSYMTNAALSPIQIRDLYARMLFTRIVDEHTWTLSLQGDIDFVASCRGHEAAQVGSAMCIEIGKDFTLPYYRDLGVVLTLGMTPYEVFRTYLLMHLQSPAASTSHNTHKHTPPTRHWGYHKHNIVTGPAPVATQLLHAAGIAFSSKLSSHKSGTPPVITVAYCGDGATAEPDFLEGLRFAALHQLPVIFICEQDCSPLSSEAPVPSCTDGLSLPSNLLHHRLDGSDIVQVSTAMNAAMTQARSGQGPTLLEFHLTRLPIDAPTTHPPSALPNTDPHGLRDPLVQCQHHLQALNAWDPDWAQQLFLRISTEVEHALRDALRDIL